MQVSRLNLVDWFFTVALAEFRSSAPDPASATNVILVTSLHLLPPLNTLDSLLSRRSFRKFIKIKYNFTLQSIKNVDTYLV